MLRQMIQNSIVCEQEGGQGLHFRRRNRIRQGLEALRARAQHLVLEKRRGLSVKEGAAHQATNPNKRRRDSEDNGNAASEEAAGPSRDLAVVSNDRYGSSLVPSQLRAGTSWQQRTSQSTGTQVDVRIVHDDVTIKLVNRRRSGCQALLQIVVALLELHLDLQNANGATIADHGVYCFNTK